MSIIHYTDNIITYYVCIMYVQLVLILAISWVQSIYNYHYTYYMVGDGGLRSKKKELCACRRGYNNIVNI